MKKSILVVEDESAIADSITWALTSEGFEPLWVTTMAEARSIFERRSIDCIILDIGLPDGNGADLCKWVRERSAIPLIFLSSRSGEIDKIVGLEIGADDYVTKPFSPRELVARVRSVLRRASNPESNSGGEEMISFGPFRIDSVRMQAFFFEQKLELSKTELRLLRVFVQRPGRVLSREQLMQLAWEEPESALDRTVDAHVKSLRSKLDAIKEVEPIVTHRGLGYALREEW